MHDIHDYFLKISEVCKDFSKDLVEEKGSKRKAR